MAAFDSVSRELLEKCEFFAIVTQGTDGPHVVGNWGHYARKLGIDEARIVLPAGGYQKPEENLQRDPRVQVLAASQAVHGTRKPGQGGVLHGTGSIHTEGELAERAKAAFPWARGALVIDFERSAMQL